MGGAPDRLLDGEIRAGRPRRAAGAPQLRLEPTGLADGHAHLPQVTGDQPHPGGRLERPRRRLAVGPHEPARSQQGAPEVPGDDDGRVHQPRPAQDLQDRPAGRARGLAVVVGALDRPAAGDGHDEGGAVVARRRMGRADRGDEGAGLLLRPRAGGAAQEVRALDLQVGLRLRRAGEGEGACVVGHDGMVPCAAAPRQGLIRPRRRAHRRLAPPRGGTDLTRIARHRGWYGLGGTR